MEATKAFVRQKVNVQSIKAQKPQVSRNFLQVARTSTISQGQLGLKARNTFKNTFKNCGSNKSIYLLKMNLQSIKVQKPGRPKTKDSEAMLEDIEAYSASSTWRVSGKLSISQPWQKYLEQPNCGSCYQNIVKLLTHSSTYIKSKYQRFYWNLNEEMKWIMKENSTFYKIIWC